LGLRETVSCPFVGAGGPQTEFSYLYYADGQIQKMTVTVGGVSKPINYYGYNAAGRITSSPGGDGTNATTYDRDD
jgi:hypothetical protein